MTDKISEVFKTTGQPTITYVQRDDGALEERLRGYLEEAGQLCLITGPSKTGKTTLYKQVLARLNLEPLVVQCTKDRTCEDIWKVALESVNFERVQSSSQGKERKSKVDLEASGDLGWSWLAKITGKATLGLEKTATESEVRERIVARPSPDLLIPLLKYTNYILVIEDFHYLADEQKKLLFQQWKRFVDSEITIIVLGTTHRAVDIANSNLDLVGRIAQIDVSQWDLHDLGKICTSGFKHLKTEISDSVVDFICSEAVGLPILVQQICLETFATKSIYSISDARRKKIQVDRKHVQKCFTSVANSKYAQFASHYNTLIRGPREKSRKYQTYDLVLACFTVDPIQFDLTRAMIDQRLGKLTVNVEGRPPAASVNSTLGALKKFQDNRKFELLEWRPAEDKLYIVEPSFLFYIRWRNNKGENEGIQLDFFEKLFRELNVSNALNL